LVSVKGFSRGSGELPLVDELFLSFVLPLRRPRDKALKREERLECESGAEVVVEVEGVGLEAERIEGAVEVDDEDSDEGREPPRARLNLSRMVMLRKAVRLGGGEIDACKCPPEWRGNGLLFLPFEDSTPAREHGL